MMMVEKWIDCVYDELWVWKVNGVFIRKSSDHEPASNVKSEWTATMMVTSNWDDNKSNWLWWRMKREKVRTEGELMIENDDDDDYDGWCDGFVSWMNMVEEEECVQTIGVAGKWGKRECEREK